MLALITGAVLILRGPVGRAIARRLEGTAGVSPELESRIQDLEARMAAGEEERHEIQGRLDFAERLLAEGREIRRELPR